MTTWRSKAAALTDRHPDTGDRWEEAFLKECVKHGTSLGVWLGKVRQTHPNPDQDGLIDECLTELRQIVKRLKAASDAGERWLTSVDPNANADAARTTLVSIDQLFGMTDMFRDVRRDVEYFPHYGQVAGWPEPPSMLFDRGRLDAALKHFAYEWNQQAGEFRFKPRAKKVEEKQEALL